MYPILGNIFSYHLIQFIKRIHTREQINNSHIYKNSEMEKAASGRKKETLNETAYIRSNITNTAIGYFA
jgi:hypothetical protein